ncbi:MAG: hypothetical protein ACOYMD_03550, partial [Paludibacter sp.]
GTNVQHSSFCMKLMIIYPLGLDSFHCIICGKNSVFSPQKQIFNLKTVKSFTPDFFLHCHRSQTCASEGNPTILQGINDYISVGS